MERVPGTSRHHSPGFGFGIRMKAVLYEQFGALPGLTNVADPEPPPHGVIVKVEASGVCRSDWHGWLGHDPDICLPHVPGHEFAGTVLALGSEVRGCQRGDRVTVPFVCGCGTCAQCRSGNQQVCTRQTQPGFTHWGSFAEYVAVHHADLNLVPLPDELDYATAASLGCRFATSFRAVVDQGRVTAGEWVAVHGCGGVGLSAVMIARALDARVIAIDIAEEPLRLALVVGAEATIDGRHVADVAEAINELTGGGAHVSMDALGSPATCVNSLQCLRPRGRHIQVGLLPAVLEGPRLPMDRIIGRELELRGSHGMQAHRYRDMLAMIRSGRLSPGKLLGRTISLGESIEALTTLDRSTAAGVTVITTFA